MAIFGRGQPPRPHLARPVVVPSGPIPAAHLSLVSRPVVQRGFWAGAGRSRPLRAMVAMAVIAPVAVTTPKSKTLVVSQALARPQSRRTVPKPHLAFAVVLPVQPPVPKGLTVSQALARGQSRRTVPRPHLAPLVVGPAAPPNARGLFVFQAQRRTLIGRTVPGPHLAPTVAPFTAPAPLVISPARARPRIPTPKPHLAAPNLASPVPTRTVPIVIGQALQRPLSRRTVPDPHLAPANLTPAPPVGPTLPPATIVARVGRRGGTVHLPWLQGLPAAVTGPAPNGPPILVSKTVVQRGFWTGAGRSQPLRPATAAALVGAAAVIAPKSPVPLVISQALVRPTTRRTVPDPHLAPPLVTPPPGPPPVITQPGFVMGPTIIRRAGRRGGRTILPFGTNLNPPASVGTPPVGGSAWFGLPDSKAFRFAGKMHLPPPVLVQPAATTPVARGLFLSQAVARAKTARTIPKPHLVAAPNIVVRPVPRGRFISAALNRSTRLRAAPQPHLPPPTRTAPAPAAPNRPGLFLLQALRRALVGRRAATPPILAPNTVASPASQQTPLWRPGPLAVRWSAAETTVAWAARNGAPNWGTGQLSVRWLVLGGPAMQDPVLSTSTIDLRAPIYVTKPVAGGATFYDPTADTVRFRFLDAAIYPTGAPPSATPFSAGSWEVTGISPGQVPVALCLIGPGGTITFTAGSYRVFVKITDNPESPELELPGVLVIV